MEKQKSGWVSLPPASFPWDPPSCISVPSRLHNWLRHGAGYLFLTHMVGCPYVLNPLCKNQANYQHTLLWPLPNPHISSHYLFHNAELDKGQWIKSKTVLSEYYCSFILTPGRILEMLSLSFFNPSWELRKYLLLLIHCCTEITTFFPGRVRITCCCS